MKKQISIASIVVAVASVVGIIATFLPWAVTSAFGISVSVKGIEGDGVICLIMFAAVLGVAIYSMFKDEAKWQKICICVAAAIAVLVALIDVINVLNNGFTAGIGAYLAIIAGLVGAIMPWIPIKK